MLDATVGIRTHHLMIAGTGRAGTTFLVRYLTELGLSTHLSAHPDAVADSYAEAGFEEVPLACDRGTLPYVIKSPSLYEYIDELLQSVHLDAAIIAGRRRASFSSTNRRPTSVTTSLLTRFSPGTNWLIWNSSRYPWSRR
jgi:hypothetical protein